MTFSQSETPADPPTVCPVRRPYDLTETYPEHSLRTTPEPAKGPPYFIGTFLGSGGLGDVSRGVQTSLGRTVALKRIKASLKLELDRIDRLTAMLRSEARTAALLDHPNIVPVYDLAEDQDGMPMAAMKLVEGKPWSRVLVKEFNRMTQEEFLTRHVGILAQVTQAVAFAHARGVVHRDLKPSQVMLGGFGEVLLMDWGLALVVDSGALLGPGGEATDWGLETPETAPGPAGTLAYMAPEQTHIHSRDVGPWTDVFLLGAILFELLTGRRPHEAPTPSQTMLLAQTEPVVLPKATEALLPPALVSLAMQALQMDPTKRVPSAKAFHLGLEDWLTGASRRKEAADASAQALSLLETRPIRYETLALALQHAERAFRLHPSHVAHGDLIDRIVTMWAEEALHQGDLRLATMQADRLEAGRDKGDLTTRIAQAKQLREARDRQRRRLQGVIVGLIVAMVVIAAIFMKELSDRADELERASLEESAAKFRAESLAHQSAMRAEAAQDLVTYMLGSLSQEMVSAIASDAGPNAKANRARMFALRDAMAQNVHEFYLAVEPSRDDPRGRRNQATSLLNVAQAFEDLALYRESGELAQRAFDFVDKDATLTHQRAWALTQLGEVARAEGRLEESERLLRQAVDEDDGSSETARAYRMNSLGNILADLGQVEEARAMFERSAASLEATLGPDHEDVAHTINNLAGVLQKAGDLDAAENRYREALEKTEAALGPNNAAVANRLNNLGNVLVARGRLREAEPVLLRSYRIVEAQYGPRHPATASVSSNVAALMFALGKLDEAIDYYERALECSLHVSGHDSPRTSAFRGNLARVLIDAGRLDDAEALLIESLKDEPTDSASNYRTCMLGFVEARTNRVDEGIARMRRALDKRLEKMPERDPVSGQMATLLGVALRETGKIEESREALELGLQRYLDSAGPTQHETALCRQQLGVTLAAMGETEKAREQLSIALDVLRATVGEDSMRTTACAEELGKLK